ncbi:MAG: DUF368 domain-containing protein [Lentisphaeria bacterium]
MITLFKDIFLGFIIGIANIIPGISGGTFALILGVFEPLMATLSRINLSLIKSFLKELLNNSNKINFINSFMKENNFYFLLRIMFGMVLAIVTLSGFISFLIKNYFQATYAFFFGLILISIIVPLRLVTKWNFLNFLLLIVGVILVIILARSSDPVQQLIEKSNIIKAQLINAEYMVGNLVNINEFLYIAVCGALAIAAMILPGLSGSLVLLVLGRYSIILGAIYSVFKLKFHLEELIVLSTFILGLVIGLIVFTRIISFIYQRYYNQTLSVLTGLVIGSLYSLWPYKEQARVYEIYQKQNGKNILFPEITINTNINRLPENEEILIPFLLIILAGIIMTFFLRKDTEKSKLTQDYE